MAYKRTPRPTTPERQRAHNTRAAYFRCCGQSLRLAEFPGASFTHGQQMNPNAGSSFSLFGSEVEHLLKITLLFASQEGLIFPDLGSLQTRLRSTMLGVAGAKGPEGANGGERLWRSYVSGIQTRNCHSTSA